MNYKTSSINSTLSSSKIIQDHPGYIIQDNPSLHVVQPSNATAQYPNPKTVYLHHHHQYQSCTSTSTSSISLDGSQQHYQQQQLSHKDAAAQFRKSSVPNATQIQFHAEALLRRGSLPPLPSTILLVKTSAGQSSGQGTPSSSAGSTLSSVASMCLSEPQPPIFSPEKMSAAAPPNMSRRSSSGAITPLATLKEKATDSDIPFLASQDKVFSSKFDISVSRTIEDWKYLLNHGNTTDYASEFWIISKTNSEKYSCRISLEGFGEGLIISEISENISFQAFQELLVHFRTLATKRNKPYLRFDISKDSKIYPWLLELGAESGITYGWQIKIPNKIEFLKKMKPELENRISNGSIQEFTGTFKLNFYKYSIDLIWENGKLSKIEQSNELEGEHTLNIPEDLFEQLILGFKSWKELQYLRPDLFPRFNHIDHLFAAPNRLN